MSTRAPYKSSASFSLAHPIACVVGPTATGKSALAQALALHLDGEIISADSMQIYKGMNIGTNKVCAPERKVTHFGLDLVDPGTPYSASLFQEYARACAYDINSRGKHVICAGGTGFYVRAFIDDYRFAKGKQTNNPVREYYTNYAREQGSDALWELLRTKDEKSAEQIHPHNVRRVVRAFELLEEGTSYAIQKENLACIPQVFPACFIGIHVDPCVLAMRINKRVDAMFDAGLVAEVESLLEAGFRDGLTAGQAIGYKEIVWAIDGEISLDVAREKIKTATRRYAKRQRSWFRHDERICWIDATNASLEELQDKAYKIYCAASRK